MKADGLDCDYLAEDGNFPAIYSLCQPHHSWIYVLITTWLMNVCAVRLFPAGRKSFFFFKLIHHHVCITMNYKLLCFYDNPSLDTGVHMGK